jgi:hypothetical protein
VPDDETNEVVEQSVPLAQEDESIAEQSAPLAQEDESVAPEDDVTETEEDDDSEGLQGTPVTKCDILEINNAILLQLRENFKDIWGQTISKNTPFWQRKYLVLFKKNKIWVDSYLSEFTYDRYFQLKSNEGEDPNFRVHEGLHIFDFRNNEGLEINSSTGSTESLVDHKNILRWSDKYTQRSIRTSTIGKQEVEVLDNNNLCEIKFNKKFMTYIENRFPIDGSQNMKNKSILKVLKRIINIILQEKYIYLSDICLLGLLLKINMLSIFDPACRPLVDESTIKTTRSEAVYNSGQLYGIEYEEAPKSI